MLKKIVFFSAQIVIYFFFISVLSSRVNANVQRIPGSWDLPYEGGAAAVGSFANSHLYLGLPVTKGQNFYYNGANEAPRPYLHTPPGPGLTIWAMYHFFGYEGSLTLLMPQLLPLIAQTISFILIAIIVLIMTNSLLLSVFATLIFTLLPMSIYFGHINEISMIASPFVLISLIAYLYYLRKPKLRYLILLLGASTLSAFYCWTGLFILPVMGVHQLIYSKFKPNKKQILFIIDCFLWELILIFLVFGQIYWADNFSFNTLKEGFDRRVMGNTSTKVGIVGFLQIYLNSINKWFTLPIFLTALFYSLLNIKNKLSGKILSINTQIIFVSLFIGLGPVLSIPYQTINVNHTIANEYWSFNLIPFFILSTIMVFKYLYDKFLNKRKYVYTIMAAFLFVVFLFGKDTIYNSYTKNGKYLPEKGHFIEIFNTWGNK
jgi:4-amino-4-deoxy-L-arabinose transferase-like glycosyltransferase